MSKLAIGQKGLRDILVFGELQSLVIGYGVGLVSIKDELLEKRYQRQRWVGTALKKIESKLRVLHGYSHLKELREAMKNLNSKENNIKLA
jgi:hypothetical protein